MLNFTIKEGYIGKDQAEFLKNFINDHDIKNVMEIGFNAGVSSSVMLSANKAVRVTSFDIGEHSYVQDAKKTIDTLFPGRHVLVIGDSTITVPVYETDQVFDMVFVDGGHDGLVPELDIKNACKFVRDGGYIIVDDFCTWYGKDVITSVNTCVRENVVIVENGPHYGDGDRAWVVLKKC